MLLTKLLLLFFISFVWPPLALADVYFYQDKKGNLHFSQYQVDDNYKLLMRTAPAPEPAKFRGWTDGQGNWKKPAKISSKLRQKYHLNVVKAANKHKVEPALLHAVISAESAYNPTAVSKAGAQGLMQLMPNTAKSLGVSDPFDVKDNLDGGAKHLKKLLTRYSTKSLALAAYNAGEGAVAKHGNQIPPYPETQRYVRKVMSYYQDYIKLM